jgi:hypothetical protein
MAVAAGVVLGWSGAAVAESGEFWEITQKMEMPGMPMAMPETTVKVCLPKGGESDPRQSMRDPQGECEMTDIVSQGDKTTWKMRCNQNGEVMTGSGEVTSSPSSYQGVMHLAGNSGGMAINMTQHYRGKKIGGSCATAVKQ